MTTIFCRKLALFLLLGAPLLSASTQTKISDWPKGHGSVLSGEQAKALSKQCSRPSLTGIQTSWQPTTRQIARLELQLDRYLRQDYPAVRQQIGQRYFQYAGLTRKQHRFIYINVIDEYAQNNPDWRHTAMIMCDGGEHFWGVEYDPSTEKFSAIVFNSGL